MLVIAAPAWSLIRVMWYSNGPGNDSNCHPKSEPQNSLPFAVSSAGISTCTGWPAIAPPLECCSAEPIAPAGIIGRDGRSPPEPSSAPAGVLPEPAQGCRAGVEDRD